MAAILIVDDDAALREGMAETLTDLGHTVIEAADGPAALALAARRRPDAVLLDLRMPGMDGLEVLSRLRALPDPPAVAVLTAHASAANTIEAMRLGAADHLVKPVGRADLAALLDRLLFRASVPVPPPVAREPGQDALVGASAVMREVQKAIGLLADSEATVLISGETGTGKEVVARAIHLHGRRTARPFVAVNCAAIPAELLESRAVRPCARRVHRRRSPIAPARSERRQGGTLFLDEIGDMRSRRCRRSCCVCCRSARCVPVGGRAGRRSMCASSSATHRDLRARVAEGRFREDLVLPPRRGAALAAAVARPAGRHRPARGALPGARGGARRRSACRRTPPRGCSRMRGPATCASFRTRCSGRRRSSARPVIERRDLDFLAPPAAEAAMPDWLDGDLDTAVARLERAMIARALAESRRQPHRGGEAARHPSPAAAHQAAPLRHGAETPR